MRYPDHLQKLIQVLKKLPGVGHKSAERFAFNLLTWPNEHLQDLAATVYATKEKLKQCKECGCLMSEEGCHFCHSSKRDSRLMCIVASPRDVFSIEETHTYQGFYHVLGGLLSPLDQKGPSQLTLELLKTRIQNLQVKEVIIALDSTLEGDTTALFIKEEIKNYPVEFSRLAFGLPMGSALDYVDGGTLARALSYRNQF